jgi:hypothetical protein
MNARSRLLLALAAIGLASSCPLLGSEEEPFEGSPAEGEDRVPVVDDVGPFDPSEAVDDDDGAVVLADTDDPTDGDAFRSEDGGSPPTEAAENERAGAELGSSREPVAGPAEVEAKKEQHEEQVERAEEGPGDEDQAKIELGHNPPPEPARESEPAWDEALDYALEALIVAAFAALLAAAIVFARSHPKTVISTSVGIGLVGWFLWSQLG